MTLYFSNECQSASNTYYLNEFRFDETLSREENIERLKVALAHDYVCAKYVDNRRSKDNFLGADCIGLDVDNDHSDNPKDWVSPADIRNRFPGVKTIIHYSRNHMKEKHGQSARPRFHVIILINETNDIKMYEALKKAAYDAFPFFDSNALDAARLFFGTPNPEIEVFDGDLTLNDFFRKNGITVGSSKVTPLATTVHRQVIETASNREKTNRIPKGERNSTLLSTATRLLKRWGDKPEVKDLFLKKALCCDPPLPKDEIETIWQNAADYYHSTIKKQEGYIAPDEYKVSLQPTDYTDVGEAQALVRFYGEYIRYTPSTGIIYYNGSFWEESKTKGHKLAQLFTELQLEEAEITLALATKKMKENHLMGENGEPIRGASLNDEQTKAKKAYESAVEYKRFVLARRKSVNIAAVINELIPLIEIDVKNLDNDPFLINTPTATYDLRYGLASKREHKPKDYITKQTFVDPSSEGEELWRAAVETFFCGDKELITYVQQIVGLAAIGIVMRESLYIAYGEGRNGKSTFWDTILRVLGSYGGNISPETLTFGNRRNTKPEIAELRGKRLVVAAELEEGLRLSTSMMKQLCSTGAVYAEKKYKDPFSFLPSHTIVLYTNHLPKVGAIDDGTWRRLEVIPFNAKIEGASEIKNYGEFLFENAAGAILEWIIKGAKNIVDLGFKPEKPDIVLKAIDRYRADNDWLKDFLDECCEINDNLSTKSGELYVAYDAFCDETNNYKRSTADFYSALERAGFVRKRTSVGSFIRGLRLKAEN